MRNLHEDLTDLTLLEGARVRFRVFRRKHDYGIYNEGGALVATVIDNRANACQLANKIALMLHDSGLRG